MKSVSIPSNTSISVIVGFSYKSELTPSNKTSQGLLFLKVLIICLVCLSCSWNWVLSNNDLVNWDGTMIKSILLPPSKNSLGTTVVSTPAVIPIL